MKKLYCFVTSLISQLYRRPLIVDAALRTFQRLELHTGVGTSSEQITPHNDKFIATQLFSKGNAPVIVGGLASGQANEGICWTILSPVRSQFARRKFFASAWARSLSVMLCCVRDRIYINILF